VTLSANQITVQNGGRVTSESGGVLGDVPTVGSGDSGSVSITATDTITVSGANSVVSTSTFGGGQGGDVTLNATNQVSVLGGGRVAGESGGTVGVGTGGGGSVSISAGSAITVSDADSAVTTTTFGDGAGGGVTLSAAQVSVQNGGRVTSESGGLFVDSLGEVFVVVGAGDSGSVSISAGDTVTVSGQGSVVSTSTFGEGKGGNVQLNAGNQVSVLNGGRIAAESFGADVPEGTGGGGSVSITAGNAITVSDAGSTVSTTTFGDGAGGDVTLSANQVNVQNGGSAASESGGLIDLLGEVFVVMGSGDSGSVTITATNAINVSGAGSSVSTR
jgi:hypothetical protein